MPNAKSGVALDTEGGTGKYFQICTLSISFIRNGVKESVNGKTVYFELFWSK